MSTALDAIGVNVEALADWLDGTDEIAAGLDEEACVILRTRLDDLLSQVRGAIGTLDIRLLSLMEVGQSLAVPGYGQVVVEQRGKQTTNGTRLALRLAARVADTPCTPDGEALPPAVLCSKTAEEIVKVFALDTASTSFRSGELKSRGLRSSEFRDFADGEPKVRFMR